MWNPPKDPNGLVLKYDVEIKMVGESPNVSCPNVGRIVKASHGRVETVLNVHCAHIQSENPIYNNLET